MIWLFFGLFILVFAASVTFRLIVLHPLAVPRYGLVDLFKYFKYKQYNECKTGELVAYVGLFGKGKTLSAVHKVCTLYHLYNGTISVPTLYRYLDSGVLSVGNESLISGKRPRRCRKAKPHNIQNPLAKSITQRPEYVNLRDEVGHWEMDTVVGEKKAGQSCLLVLTERMSRKEIIIKMAGKTAACTVRALDILQRRYGADFPRIFKTITVDNGCEFADVKGIEKDGRTQLYFCHPYSSWERGSNENLNKMIRRFVPKGFSINKVSRKQVHRIQTFMNSYPRKILGWRCADDVFYEAFLKEGINLTGYQKQ